MAQRGIIDSAARASLPASTFGLPAERKYPMPNATHAVNAKARATQMVNAGKLSASAKSKIDAKANRVLGKSVSTHPNRARNLGQFLHPRKE